MGLLLVRSEWYKTQVCPIAQHRITQQCLLPYGIKPFKDEVLCDVGPLEVYDVLLGQPYMWKHHVVYELRPRSVIFNLGGKL